MPPDCAVFFLAATDCRHLDGVELSALFAKGFLVVQRLGKLHAQTRDSLGCGRHRLEAGRLRASAEAQQSDSAFSAYRAPLAVLHFDDELVHDGAAGLGAVLRSLPIGNPLNPLFTAGVDELGRFPLPRVADELRTAGADDRSLELDSLAWATTVGGSRCRTFCRWRLIRNIPLLLPVGEKPAIHVRRHVLRAIAARVLGALTVGDGLRVFVAAEKVALLFGAGGCGRCRRTLSGQLEVGLFSFADGACRACFRRSDVLRAAAISFCARLRGCGCCFLLSICPLLSPRHQTGVVIFVLDRGAFKCRLVGVADAHQQIVIEDVVYAVNVQALERNVGQLIGAGADCLRRCSRIDPLVVLQPVVLVDQSGGNHGILANSIAEQVTRLLSATIDVCDVRVTQIPSLVHQRCDLIDPTPDLAEEAWR